MDARLPACLVQDLDTCLDACLIDVRFDYLINA